MKFIDTWLKIGKKNYWIKEANDPPFTKDMFTACKTVAELQKKIQQGNWCLGQAFYYKNICFINQVNGGDEWLTIKENVKFENITFDGIIKRGEFPAIIKRIEKATLEQCKKLAY